MQEHNIELIRVNIVAVEKQFLNITYKCESVALVIQHAMGMCRIMFSSVASMSLQYLPTLSHKWHDFRTNVTERKICVLILSTTVFGNIFHS